MMRLYATLTFVAATTAVNLNSMAGTLSQTETEIDIASLTQTAGSGNGMKIRENYWTGAMCYCFIDHNDYWVCIGTKDGKVGKKESKDCEDFMDS